MLTVGCVVCGVLRLGNGAQGWGAGSALSSSSWYREKSYMVSKGLTLTFHPERPCCPPRPRSEYHSLGPNAGRRVLVQSQADRHTAPVGRPQRTEAHQHRQEPPVLGCSEPCSQVLTHGRELLGRVLL